VWDLLRLRTTLEDPRISYKELAIELREQFEEFEHITQRSQELYQALVETGERCRQLDLPLLPALVVRADSRKPGAAYFDGEDPRGEEIEEWRREVEAVKAATYPASS
jgi:hypothetical protein